MYGFRPKRGCHEAIKDVYQRVSHGKINFIVDADIQRLLRHPTLANIYMHNVLTLWFKLIVQNETRGECFLVNYADDFVAGFQYKTDAEQYYAALREGMAKFNLELE